MKIIKLQKIVVGEKPIVRVTYQNIFGLTKVRDVCKDNIEWWVFMDNGEYIDNKHIINTFYDSDYYVYEINKTEPIGPIGREIRVKLLEVD